MANSESRLESGVEAPPPVQPAANLPPSAGNGNSSKSLSVISRILPPHQDRLDTLFGEDNRSEEGGDQELHLFPREKGRQGTGNCVEGVEDYRKLDGKLLQILAHTLEKVVKTKQGSVQMCLECQQTNSRRACRNMTCPKEKNQTRFNSVALTGITRAGPSSRLVFFTPI